MEERSINGDGRTLAALSQRASDHERRLSTNEARMERYGEALQQLMPLVRQAETFGRQLDEIQRAQAAQSQAAEAKREWEEAFRLDLQRFAQEQRRDLRGSVIAAAAVGATLFGAMLTALVVLLLRALGKG